VDDPILSTVGSAEACSTSLDLVVLWWCTLGLPLSWAKGFYGTGDHKWIGAIFSNTLRDNFKLHVLIKVPEDFVDTVLLDLAPFLANKTVTDKQVDVLLGRAGRLSYLIPAARPFVTALWGAASGSRRAARDGRRDAPPGHLPTQRFKHAAAWIKTLLSPPSGRLPLLPLEHAVVKSLPAIDLKTAPRVELDASPWGGGAILFEQNVPSEYFYVKWDETTASFLNAPLGEASSMTTYELLTVFLALVRWATSRREVGLAILGDNVSSLEVALHLKGRASLATIAREVSWRRARFGWNYVVGHIPTEINIMADTLSRIYDPNGNYSIPAELLNATAVNAPLWDDDLWACA